MTNSIFEKPYWLDALSQEGIWSESIVKINGEVVARLPYFLVVRNGLRYIEMPPFTQTLGPFLKIDGIKATKIISKEKELIGQLISQLPDYDSLKICLHWSFKNWMPFYWKGFSQTTRYTYQIRDIQNLDKVWDGFDQKIRTDIRKAEKILKIDYEYDIEKFHELTAKTYIRQGIECPYKFETIKILHSTCQKHNCSKMYFAIDENKNIHSAIYVIWDHNVAYYLIGGSDPKYRNSGANSFLIWQAIKEMSKKVQIFDFEGSMIESVERFFRGFGGIPIPYSQISKNHDNHSRKQIIKKILKNIKVIIKLFIHLIYKKNR